MTRVKTPASTIDPPDWLDAETWAAFVEMRKAKGQRAPLTTRAQQMIVAKLNRLRADGHDPNACLAESVMNGWSGVFPLKVERKPDGTLRAPEKPWHETFTGIVAKGVELGLGDWTEERWARGGYKQEDDFNVYRRRVYRAAGYTPPRRQ